MKKYVLWPKKSHQSVTDASMMAPDDVVDHFLALLLHFPPPSPPEAIHWTSTSFPPIPNHSCIQTESPQMPIDRSRVFFHVKANIFPFNRLEKVQLVLDLNTQILDLMISSAGAHHYSAHSEVDCIYSLKELIHLKSSRVLECLAIKSTAEWFSDSAIQRRI